MVFRLLAFVCLLSLAACSGEPGSPEEKVPSQTGPEPFKEEVSLVTEAGGGFGYARRPEPRIKARVPDTAGPRVWWGDKVTLWASDLALSPTENHAQFPFQSVPAEWMMPYNKPGQTNEYQVRFTVPDDARFEGSLTVTAAGISSPPDDPTSPLLQVSPPLNFSGIHSMAFVPEVSGADYGHVLVADTTGVHDVDLFKRTPTMVRRVSGNHFISRVTNGHKVLMVSPEQGHAQIMELDVDPSSAPPTKFQSTEALGRQIKPACIAAAPDGNAAFIADSLSGSIIKVSRSGQIQDRIGRQTPFSFLDPCGIDVLGGILVVTTPDGVFRMTTEPGETAVLIEPANGKLIRSIELSRMNYATTGQPARESHYRPALAWVFNPATRRAGTVYASDDGTYLILNTPVIFFAHNHAHRILVENPSQAGIQFAPLDQDQIGDATAVVSINTWANSPLYVRIIDPPDTAPYASSPSGTYTPDNKSRVTTSWGLAESSGSKNWAQCLMVRTDASAHARLYLRVPTTNVGDNFRIEVSRQPWGPGCSSNNNIIEVASPLYTSWRRLFLENDLMFKKGGFLAKTARKGDRALYVAKTPLLNKSFVRTDGIQVGDRVALFDTKTPYEGPHDEACVLGLDENFVGPGMGPAVEVRLDACPGETFSGLAQEYQASVTTKGQYKFDTGRLAAVGVVTAGQEPFHRAELGGLQLAFSDGFIDIVAPESGAGAVPFLAQQWLEQSATSAQLFHPKVTEALSLFDQAWFFNFAKGGIGNRMNKQVLRSSLRARPPHNYLHATGAPRHSLLDGVALVGRGGVFAFSGNYDGKEDQPHVLPAKRLAMVHEIGHLFALNPCNTGHGGHDTRTTWCDTQTTSCDVFPDPPDAAPSTSCVMMASVPPLPPPQARFCLEDLLGTQQTCANALASNRNSIRYAPDPF